jgi:hypothetical protein
VALTAFAADSLPDFRQGCSPDRRPQKRASNFRSETAIHRLRRALTRTTRRLNALDTMILPNFRVRYVT